MPETVRFPRAAGDDRMPLLAQRLDHVAAVDADRLPGTAMVASIPLDIADDAGRADLRLRDRHLGNATAGRLQRLDTTGHRFERASSATCHREFVESMHHAMSGHDQIAIDADGLFGLRRDGPLVGAIEHVADQVVGVGKRAFEVVAAPARSVEPAVTAAERGHGRSSTLTVPLASRVTSRCRSHSGRLVG